MALKTESRGFLAYLRANPALRTQIRAAPNQTLLYAGAYLHAGSTTRPAWREVELMRRTHSDVMAGKQTLPEVLIRIAVPGTGYPNLLAYTQSVESQVPWKPDGFILWRALSGIFASNAQGAVSYCVLSGINVTDKVFAATEISVLLRNPAIDPVSRDVLEYYRRCIASKTEAINFSYFPAT